VHVVQPPVSAAISRLETELVQQFLIQAQQSVRSASCGCLPFCERMADSPRGAPGTKKWLPTPAPIAGTVTIGGPLSTGTFYLGNVLQNLRRPLPLVDVRIRVSETMNDWHIAFVQDGPLDLALLPRTATVPRGRSLPIGLLRLILVTAAHAEDPGHRWTTAEVDGLATIDFPPYWPDRRQSMLLSRDDVRATVEIVVPDVAAAVDLVCVGLGAAFLAASLVARRTGVQVIDLGVRGLNSSW
jgi:DNA-binding transcriptional LysR family regulator